MPFVNDPAGIQHHLDPRFFLDAAERFAPPALITSETSQAERFLRRHRTIVIKRSNSCGGRGVYRLALARDGGLLVDNLIEGSRVVERFSELFASLTGGGWQPVLLMRYLPRVTEGDKRVVVVDGEIYGGYLRRSADGHWVQNVSLGGDCELAPVQNAERAAIAATYRRYQRAGIHVLGYDFIRDDDGRWRLSEINAGNVGGLARLEHLGVRGITDRFVDWLQTLRDRSRGSVFMDRRLPLPDAETDGSGLGRFSLSKQGAAMTATGMSSAAGCRRPGATPVAGQ